LGLLKPHVHHEWTSELDEILESGYEIGGKASHNESAANLIGCIVPLDDWDRASQRFGSED
jgi:hypothetical protein